MTLHETAESAYRVHGINVLGALSLLAILQGDVQLNLKIHYLYYKHLSVIDNVVYC